MRLWEEIAGRARHLPQARQQEVLDFLRKLEGSESLESAESTEGRTLALKGLWSDLGIDLRESDLTQARAQIWGNFPHSDL